MNSDQTGRWQGYEFTLVVVMLGVLTLLVMIILLSPESSPTSPSLPASATAEQILSFQKDSLVSQKEIHDYRKDVVSLVLTAFGAWVGAGAAYFFGRESLRDANTLLRMREINPQERLNQTKISELPLKTLEIVAKLEDPVAPVVERLKQSSKLWFVAIVDESGKLVDMIHKEGIWRYVADRQIDLQGKTLQDVRDYLTANEPANLEIYAPVTMDMTIGKAHELLTKKEIYVAVVVDSNGKPLQYFDTGDVRKFLLT
jgi:hypothetical protein